MRGHWLRWEESDKDSARWPVHVAAFGDGSLGKEYGREVQAERLACAKHWRANAKPPGVQVSTAKFQGQWGIQGWTFRACSGLLLAAFPPCIPGQNTRRAWMME